MATPSAPEHYVGRLDSELPSPCFVVDVARVRANCARVHRVAAEQRLGLRPHVKTHKTVEAARLQTAHAARGEAKIVVSTLAEAEFFADNSFGDILYGVPLEPSKLARAWALHCRLPAFHVMLDSVEALDALAAHAKQAVATLADQASDEYLQAARRVSVFVAVDCGYHREGVQPGTEEARAVVRAVVGGRHTRLAGLYSHSGNSYNCGEAGCAPEQARAGAAAVACAERDAMLAFAASLRLEDGVEVPVVSIGATPSASSCIQWDGGGGRPGAPSVELHPGNYAFFDRQQVASGSCGLDDVAVYVVARVVGRYPATNSLLVDAGGCALHKDTGGLPDWASVMGHPSLTVTKLTQEVGTVTTRDGSLLDDSRFPLGAVLRLVPNHACMTAAGHPHYFVVDSEAGGARGAVVGAAGGDDRAAHQAEFVVATGDGMPGSVGPRVSEGPRVPAAAGGAAAPAAEGRRVVAVWRPVKFW
jgi:D-serine deaminase-like pyridoxal phosphate-dependent protein